MAAKFLTLSRKDAKIKIACAKKAVYFFAGASYYEREVPLPEVVEAFAGNAKWRLRIERETSAHLIYIPGLFTQGYRIEF